MPKGDNLRTHGMSRTPIYNSWIAMKARCYDPNHKDAHSYQSRGIVVCDRWLHSFENFYADMGPKPGPEYSVERINNEGIYEPGNCKWALPPEQARNTRQNRTLTYNGMTMCVTDWGRHLGIPNRRIWNRVQRGMPIEKILATHELPRHRKRNT